jgi:hypothetical protein
MVRAFTQNPSLVYEPEKNGKFALFDGNINGTFIELVIIFSIYKCYYNTKLNYLFSNYFGLDLKLIFRFM